MADLALAEPTRVVAVGDLHGNYRWAIPMIGRSPELFLPGQRRIFLQFGDFGVWPGDTTYLTLLTDALVRQDAELWFLPGNHEEWPKLLRAQEGWDGKAPIEYRRRIYYLPRNYRWTWHGRTWLALGGAVSMDRSGLVIRRDEHGQKVKVPYRTEGQDWWPEEAITDEEFQAAIDGGPADVMATHACPAGVVHSFEGRTPSWFSPVDAARAHVHDTQLQSVVNAVRPRHLIHGHLHMLYQRTTEFGYGPCEVTGLHCDGEDGNYIPLDIDTMTWHPELV